MQDLLAEYLFKNKICPLPGIGSLLINDGTAVSHYAEMKIAAPVPSIQFSNKQITDSDLIKYISLQKNITAEDAKKDLNAFCKKFNFLDLHENLNITDAGKFFINSIGSLQFKQTVLSNAFLPIIPAERVIHPDASHEILVGDTQTTNTLMSEFYNDQEVKTNDRWWLWAILLFIIAAVIIVIYLNDNSSNLSFGIAQPYYK